MKRESFINVEAVANNSGAMEQKPFKTTGGIRKAIRVDVINTICDMKKALLKFALGLLVVVSLGIGISACTESKAQSGGSSKVIAKIPDGTYTRTFTNYQNVEEVRTLTFSGNKYKSGNIENDYIIRDDDIIVYRDDFKVQSNALIYKYFLDGNKLIIFYSFYTSDSKDADRHKGTVYTKN
jgi:hypothetical protein